MIRFLLHRHVIVVALFIACFGFCQTALAYICTDATEPSPLTLPTGTHIFTNCVLQGTVSALQPNTQATFNNCSFIGAAQLLIGADVGVVSTSTTYGNTGSRLTPSIIISSFGPLSKIRFTNTIFVGFGLISVSAASGFIVTPSTEFIVEGSNLLGASRQPGYVLAMVAITQLTLQGGSVIITSSFASPASLITLNGNGFLEPLSILNLISTVDGGVVKCTNNTEFNLLMALEDGTFSASAKGSVEVTDNTAVSINGNTATIHGVITCFYTKQTGNVSAQEFVFLFARNVITISMPGVTANHDTYGVMHAINFYRTGGMNGTLIVHKNIITSEVRSANVFRTGAILLGISRGGNVAQTIVPCSAHVVISDNAFMLDNPLSPGAHTAIQFFWENPNYFTLNGEGVQIWILRNKATFLNVFSSVFGTLVYAYFGTLSGGSRLLIDHNIVTGPDGASLLFSSTSRAVPSDGTFQISWNHVKASSGSDTITTNYYSYFLSIIISYNVVTDGPEYFTSGNPSIRNAQICSNKFENGYINVSATYTITGVVTSCPSLSPSQTANPTPTLAHSALMTISPSPRIAHTASPPLPDDESTTTEPNTTTTGGDNFASSKNSSSTYNPPIIKAGVDETAVVGVTAGGAVVGGALAQLDSISSLQLSAMFTLMACRTVDGNANLMRFIVTPLSIHDASNANNLIGSFILLLTGTVVYSLLVGVAILIASRSYCGTPRHSVINENNITDNDDIIEVDEMRANRVNKVKVLLLYPRPPFMLALLLLPGIVLESGSLLYGSLSGGFWWERILGVVGLVFSIALTSYQIIVGVLVARVLKKEEEEEDIYEVKYAPSTDGGAINRRSSSYQRVSSPSTPTRSQQHNGDPVPDDDELMTHALTTATTSIVDHDAAMFTNGHHRDKLDGSSVEEKDIVVDGEGMAFDEVMIDEAVMTTATAAVMKEYCNNRRCSVRILSNTSNTSRRSSVASRTPSSHQQQQHSRRASIVKRLSVLEDATTTHHHHDKTKEQRLFTAYTPEQTSSTLPIVGLLFKFLVAKGRWAPVVNRSGFYPVTNIRAAVVAFVCGHAPTRIILVGIVGAVNGRNDFECGIVQGLIAAICFLHGILIILTQSAKIPTLSVLQGLQSIVLGLLACVRFINNATAQYAFTSTLLVLSFAASFLGLVSFIIEWRLARAINNKQHQQLD